MDTKVHLKNTMPETVGCYADGVEEIAFPENRVRPLVERVREFGPYRLNEKAQGWWETEDDGFVLLVAWNQNRGDKWEFFLRWECEDQKGAAGIYLVEAEDGFGAMEELLPAIKTILSTPVAAASTNGNGHHPEKDGTAHEKVAE